MIKYGVKLHRSKYANFHAYNNVGELQVDAYIIGKVKFRNAKLGYVRVDDGSVIILRVAIIDVRLQDVISPFGVEFEVNVTTGITVYPSSNSLNEVKNKPTIEPGRIVKEGWVQVNIVEKASAHEEIVYNDKKVGTYLVRVDIEPIMVSKNLLYKTVHGVPWYIVRWVPKVAWSKIQE